MWLTGKERSQGQLLDLEFEQRVRYWLYLLRWIRKEIEVENIKHFEFHMPIRYSRDCVWLAVRSRLRDQNNENKVVSHVNIDCIKVMRLTKVICKGRE